MKAKSTAKVRSSHNDSGGALHLVGTPIGNLEDITLRAIRVLREADLIACEDTRQTQKLLSYYKIQKPTVSYHEHNELTRAPELVLKLEEGARIALVSDAGMPGLSDPGYRLVGLCIRHNVPVIPIPGPSAVIAGLVASGLPTHTFQFCGFLPARKTARRKILEARRELMATSIFFESPHRIVEALEEVLEVFGDRPVVVARELTKMHEEFVRGKCSTVLEELRKRASIPGEITLLVAGAGENHTPALPLQPVKARVEELMQQGKLSRMKALKTVARERHISKRQAYREFEEQ